MPCAMDIEVSSAILAALQEQAALHAPREACGILFGVGTRVDALVEAANVHPTPETHFEIDPQALIDAHRAARAGGPQIVGYYHSHPKGDAIPSETDRAMAPGDGKIWAIIAREEVRFWLDASSGFHALSYDIIGR